MLGAVLLEESCAEMDVGVLVVKEVTMRQQIDLVVSVVSWWINS